MKQEKPFKLTFKEFQRLRYPIGYIFEYVPTDGSPVDLTTPEKVGKYFGFGIWRLLSKGLVKGVDGDAPQDKILHEGDPSIPMMVPSLKYTVIDSNGTVHFMPNETLYLPERDKNESVMTFFPVFLPTSLSYRFVMDKEGMIYRYPLKSTVFPDNLDDYRLIYSMDDRYGLYTVITPEGGVYRYPNDTEYDPGNIIEDFKIDDLTLDKKPIKYRVRNRDSESLIDVSTLYTINDMSTHTLKIDSDRDSVVDLDAVYDYSSGIYVIDTISHSNYYDVGGVLVDELPYPVYGDPEIDWLSYEGKFLVVNRGARSSHPDVEVTEYYTVKTTGETQGSSGTGGSGQGNENQIVNTHKTIHVQFYEIDLTELWPATTQLNSKVSRLFELLGEAEVLANGVSSSQAGTATSLNIDLSGLPDAINRIMSRIETIQNEKQDKLKFDKVPVSDSANPVESKGIVQHIDEYIPVTYVYRWVRIA